MSTLEHARGGITSSSSSHREDGRINALEASVNKLQGMINDVVYDKHEVEELSARLNITIWAVGNQPVLASGGIEFTRAKVLEPRNFGGAHDTKDFKNFLFNIVQYF